MQSRLFYDIRLLSFIAVFLLLLMASQWGMAMGLIVERSGVLCGVPARKEVAAPVQASARLPDSQVVQGHKDIAWAWFGSPTMRYPHRALGASTHGGSLHVLWRPDNGAANPAQELVFELPLNRVFEDRVPRLVDLDGDGRDELVVIEADALRGAATVVYGVQTSRKVQGAEPKPSLVELARSASVGSTFLWLNPVGAADFDADGKLDFASVITPHIGGILTLYRYAPPHLLPFARAMDISNHRMGDVEQQLAVIVAQKGARPTIIVPDMQLKALHALRWEAPGQWKELADVKPLPAPVKRITPIANGACVLLTDATWWRVWLMD
jgi:hypothetical protein